MKSHIVLLNWLLPVDRKSEPEWVEPLRNKYRRKFGIPDISMMQNGQLYINIGYDEYKGLFMSEIREWFDVTGLSFEEIWGMVSARAKDIQKVAAA